jgi:choline-sulfatase
MRFPIVRLLRACFLALAAPLLSSATFAAARPNILVLFTDDQAFDTIRSLGSLDIDTPHLDRLVARGTTFTHAYNMGSFSPAVCVASRTMLMTGRSLWDTERVYARTDEERAAGRLWPQLMRAAGYRAYFTGKWHVQTDAAQVFDVVRHVRPGMPRDVPEGYNRPLAGQPDPWSPSDRRFGGFWTGGKHWTEVTADDAVDYLREAGSRPEPFFMYVAFNAPHDPRQSPQAYVDRYPAARVPVPRNFLPEYPHKEAIGAGKTLRDEKLAPFPRTEESVRVQRGEYYAIVSHLDTHVGRVLAALEASGKAADTWIFLSSDHGLAVGQHGLFGKQNLYDHSVRVPFVVVGPGVAAGRRLAVPIYLQDMMPTALALAGVERPVHVYFRSLLPLLRDAAAPAPYPEIYGAYLRLQRSVVHEGWKLIQYPAGGVTRLYDVGRDPEERADLAADPAHAPRRAALEERLRRLQGALGDPLLSGAAAPAGGKRKR